MDRIDKIIIEAILITDVVAASSPELTQYAVEALLQIRRRLESAFPDHPALGRVDKYLERLEREQSSRPN